MNNHGDVWAALLCRLREAERRARLAYEAAVELEKRAGDDLAEAEARAAVAERAMKNAELDVDIHMAALQCAAAALADAQLKAASGLPPASSETWGVRP